jgi:hypothetical protein
MATSVALIPVTDGIRVRIIYQLVQRRSRPDDGGSRTLLYRARQFETASSLLGKTAASHKCSMMHRQPTAPMKSMGSLKSEAEAQAAMAKMKECEG